MASARHRRIEESLARYHHSYTSEEYSLFRGPQSQPPNIACIALDLDTLTVKPVLDKYIDMEECALQMCVDMYE